MQMTELEVQADFDGEDAFAQLVSLAVEKDPTLAKQGAKHLAGSRGAAPSVLGASQKRAKQ
jgi:hypothetical protein